MARSRGSNPEPDERSDAASSARSADADWAEMAVMWIGGLLATGLLAYAAWFVVQLVQLSDCGFDKRCATGYDDAKAYGLPVLIVVAGVVFLVWQSWRRFRRADRRDADERD